MGTINAGVYASYIPPPDRALSKASIRSLMAAGVMLEDLKESGYPQYIQDMFEEVLKEELTKGAGRNP